MASETVVTDIAAPPDRVWQSVIDVDSWPRLMDSVTSVERLDAGPLRVGSRVKVKNPGLPVFTWVVTELDEGISFTWVVRSPGVESTAVHQVTPADAGSRLTLTMTWSGPLGGLAGALVGKRARNSIIMEANGHKAAAETPA
jgi:uncharacterized membrane protein